MVRTAWDRKRERVGENEKDFLRAPKRGNVSICGCERSDVMLSCSNLVGRVINWLDWFRGLRRGLIGQSFSLNRDGKCVRGTYCGSRTSSGS